MPPASWKINDPGEVAAFMAELEKFDPAINNYSDRQVLIVFNDQDLAGRFETELADLQARKASGALLITAERQIEVVSN